MFVGHPILEEIRQGCHLRPTKTIDKSKPVILVEGENLSKDICRLKPRPEPSNPPTPQFVVPPPPPNAPILPPPTIKKAKPVTNPALLKLGGKQNVDRDELMRKIRDGVQLRKVITVDKSAPTIIAEGEIPKVRLLSSSNEADDQPVMSSQQPLNSDSSKHSLGNLVNYSSGEDVAVKSVAVQPANCSDSADHHLQSVASQPTALPPHPPPMPSHFNTLPRAQKPLSGNMVFDGREDVANNTIPRTKKADECYTSPIPTRKMIEAEIPTGSASNRIKLLNSLHCRAQSQSPVRTVHRVPPQKCLHPVVSVFGQQNGAVDANAQTRCTKFPSSLYKHGDNQPPGDISSIKAMAKRFDGNFNMNESSNPKVIHRPLRLAHSFNTANLQNNQKHAEIAAESKPQENEQLGNLKNETQTMRQKINQPEPNNLLKVFEEKQISNTEILNSSTQRPVFNSEFTCLNRNDYLPTSSEPSTTEKSQSTFIIPQQNERAHPVVDETSNDGSQQSSQLPEAVLASANQPSLVSANFESSSVSASHNATAQLSMNFSDQQNNFHSAKASTISPPPHTNPAPSTSFPLAQKTNSSFSQNSSTSLCILSAAGSTDSSILPSKKDLPKPNHKEEPQNSSLISKYSLPIQIDTSDIPPPIPASAPPKMPSSGQGPSILQTDGSPQSTSSSKTGTGRYRYIKQIGGHSPSSSSFGTPSSHSFVSSSPSSHSNVSPLQCEASQVHSPSSSSPESRRDSDSKPFGSDSHRSSSRSYAGSEAYESALEEFPTEKEQPQHEQFSLRSVAKSFLLKNSKAASANTLEHEQSGSRAQWVPMTTSSSNSHLEPEQENPTKSKTYSVPILAPWYDPQKYENDSAHLEVIHLAESRNGQKNDHREFLQQGVGRAHKIIVGVGDMVASRFHDPNPDVLSANYKFSINLNDEEPLRLVPR